MIDDRGACGLCVVACPENAIILVRDLTHRSTAAAMDAPIRPDPPAALRWTTEPIPNPETTMPTTPEPAARQTFMVVGTIRQDTNFDEFATRRADEHRQLALLQSQGDIGAHRLSLDRMTVFLEVFATYQDDCAQILASLPFHDFFDPDTYPISTPAAN